MQLDDYLKSNSLLPHCQSPYRERHSTVTATLLVKSELLTAADGRKVTLLDTSAAFDCVDHAILLQRLHLRFSLTDDVINWSCSFLTGRSQQVVYNGTESSAQPVLFGVPQG